MHDLKTIIRFLTKINHTGNCWEWKAAVNNSGYGRFHLSKKHVLAHRFSYELFRGDIPKGMTLDHLCRNKTCVNPEHLEIITLKENILRGFGTGAKNARKTHCPKGHPLKGDNLVKTQLKLGWRTCRICNNEYQRQYYYH